MNTNKQRHKTRMTIKLAALAGVMFYLTPVSNASTSYLLELEAEAARTGDEETTAPSATQDEKWAEKDRQLDSEYIEAGLGKKEFESQLEKNFYGSYLFYSTLDASKQQDVYHEYKNANDIESIRNSIKSRLKE
ncbi:MAG: hypothetical protein R6X15_07885 [Pseudomonadota bacterium]